MLFFCIKTHHHSKNLTVNSFKVYNLQINREHKIEFVFSNATSIDLAIDYLNLVAEKVPNSNDRFLIELKHLANSQTASRGFVVPAHTKEFKIEFEFVYETLESFEIIGTTFYFVKLYKSSIFLKYSFK